MEINMKNITKVGLSALAGSLAFTAVHAGDVSISGSMIASYTKKGGQTTTGNPLGMDKELTITGSGELDNGVGVAYKQTVTDAMAYNDSELVFSDVPMLAGGTLAMTSTGSPLDAIDDKTPIAFEEANAAVGSIDDVAGSNGDYGLRYTLSDMMGTGIKLDAMYVPKTGSGDSATEKGVSGTQSAQGNEDAYEVTLTGAVPMVDGLSFGVGGAQINKSNAETAASSDQDQQEATAYLNYAIGAVKIGAQKSVVNAAGTGEISYITDYYGISYAVSDNLSVSYNKIESDKSRKGTSSAESVEQDFDSISLSYTAGGMTIGILDADADNSSYTKDKKTSARAIQLSVAF
jgi:outer membrane protein OmpU